MATSRLVYNGNLRLTATHLQSGTEILTDAPTDNNGKGEAFSPTDLTATSLGACIMTTMAIGAEPRNIEINSMEAQVTKVMVNGPRKIAEIIVDLKLSINPDTPDNRKTLEDIGNHCPVARSLHPDLIQTITYSYN